MFINSVINSVILVFFCIIHGHIPSEFPDQEHCIIVDFITAKIQEGLLADKNREGRCSGDYFVFTVCKILFFWLYRSVGFKGNITYAKKVSTSAR